MNTTNLSHQKRILIIEDSPDIREALAALLSLENYEVALAAEGQEGLNYLYSTADLPDLILLDLLMPGKDGYQFLQEQKLDPRISNIPVIIMTANQMQDAKALGTAGFMRKPVMIEQLISIITDILSLP